MENSERMILQIIIMITINVIQSQAIIFDNSCKSKQLILYTDQGTPYLIIDLSSGLG